MTHRAVLPLALTAIGAAGGVRALSRRHAALEARVAAERGAQLHRRLGDIGSVASLRVLPLADRSVSAPELRGEAGVSYLVEADGARILFDLSERPGTVLHNAEALGVEPGDADAIVLSHLHSDHVGGPGPAGRGSFRVDVDVSRLRAMTVFAPAPMTHDLLRPRPTTQPVRIAPGIALLPPLPAAVFLDSAPVYEQALLVNVRGRGLVVISGCGHPGVPAVLEATTAVLDVAVHAFVGGLHLPVDPFPTHLPQALLGVPRPWWRPLSRADVDAAAGALTASGVCQVYVSGHDTTNAAIDRLRAHRGLAVDEVRVGGEIRISSPGQPGAGSR